MSADRSCDLCTGIETVTYPVSAAGRPAPFCSRCGRTIPARVVADDSPGDPAFRAHARLAKVAP